MAAHVHVLQEERDRQAAEIPLPDRQTQKMVVVVNCKAGSCLGEAPATQRQRLAQLFQAAGLAAEIHCVDSRQLVEVLGRLKTSGVDIVVVGGGDGTLNAAANCLAGTGIALGILPLGTFNHFARDLEIPLVLEEAVQVLAEGVLQTIDVGEVNGHVFINNASLGIYPHIVKRRQTYQTRLGWRKLPAMGYALWGIFWRLPVLKIWLQANGQRQFLKAPFVFIGNNRYADELFTFWRRPSLTEGHLSVFYTHQIGRWALIKIVFKVLFRGLREVVELEKLWVKEVRITSRKKKKLGIALDGEAMEITPPLVFRSRPRSLKVIVPRGG